MNDFLFLFPFSFRDRKEESCIFPLRISTRWFFFLLFSLGVGHSIVDWRWRQQPIGWQHEFLSVLHPWLSLPVAVGQSRVGLQTTFVRPTIWKDDKATAIAFRFLWNLWLFSVKANYNFSLWNVSKNRNYNWVNQQHAFSKKKEVYGLHVVGRELSFGS